MAAMGMASVVGSSSAASLQSCVQRPRCILFLHGRAPLRMPALLSRRPSSNLRVSASASPSATPASPSATPASSFSSQAATLLSDSTRTVASLSALALALSKVLVRSAQSLVAKAISVAMLRELAGIREIRGSLASSVGPLFFAALRGRPKGNLNTPLTVVAAGLSRWLEIYSGVLMIRVLLSWFPNIPWDRQPLSAIRDLCDPYLNLFRNIIPPVLDTLDISPLFAFAVLGTLSSILYSSKSGH